MEAPNPPMYAHEFTDEQLRAPASFNSEKHKLGLGPRINIDHTGFIIWVRRHSLEAADIGALFQAIAVAAVRRDWGFILAYPWIGRRIYAGTSTRPGIPAPIRQRVLAIGKCARCGSSHKLEVDHVVPYSRGGAHEESNFQALCRRCNRTKHNKLEEELGNG